MPKLAWCGALLGAILPTAVIAEPRCPAAIRRAAGAAVPGATVARCGRDGAGFEARLVAGDRVVEVELDPGGALRQIEEAVPIAAVPDLVRAAAAARYPRARIVHAVRQVAADGGVTFEVAVRGRRGRVREATYTADGAFVAAE